MFDWQDFLTITPQLQPQDEITSQGTQLEVQKPIIVCPLTHYQLIIVEGPDALRFLQGQCTCDFAKLDESNHTLGAHCTPKGRMISSFLAAKTGENQFTLRVCSTTAQPLLTALQKYAVFSKVSLTISNDIACFAVLNNDQETKDNTADKDISAYKFIQHSGAVELWLTSSQIHTYLSTYLSNTQIHAVPTRHWDLLLIKNGIGEVRAETIEKLLPQEINLQLTGGIDFKKGCYTGQEIVARIHYKAQLKKHMYRGIAYGLPHTLQRLKTEEHTIINKTTNVVVGNIILSAKNDQGAIEFLSLINDEQINNTNLTIHENSQAKIEWLTLPYAIT